MVLTFTTYVNDKTIRQIAQIIVAFSEKLNFNYLLAKALSKQEGPNICWDARFLNFNQLPAAKKVFKKRASQQTFGPSCFDRALV